MVPPIELWSVCNRLASQFLSYNQSTMRSVQLAIAALVGLGAALPQEATNKQYKRTENNIQYNIFEHAATDTTLKYVSNSGICETTPGVNQHSGYQTVGESVLHAAVLGQAADRSLPQVTISTCGGGSLRRATIPRLRLWLFGSMAVPDVAPCSASFKRMALARSTAAVRSPS